MTIGVKAMGKYSDYFKIAKICLQTSPQTLNHTKTTIFNRTCQGFFLFSDLDFVNMGDIAEIFSYNAIIDNYLHAIQPPDN